jgi:hypothetical protein
MQRHRQPGEETRMNFARIAARLICVSMVLTVLLRAQTPPTIVCDALRQPGWNYGGQIFGGFTVVQVTSPNFLTANRNISNLSLAFHLGRVLTHEHGPGLTRGTLEWDFNVIPVEIFWVLGSHYAGGFEPVGFRWNLTRNRHRIVPFAGVAGGLLFSPQNFPPGNTYQMNFTAAIDAGTRIYVRHRQSIAIIGRVFHLSNSYLGPLNPGIPVGLQFGVEYLRY